MGRQLRIYDQRIISPPIMMGLHYLKHTFDLIDEEVVALWVENPYWQYFCGMKYFEHEPPIDPSSSMPPGTMQIA